MLKIRWHGLRSLMTVVVVAMGIPSSLLARPPLSFEEMKSVLQRAAEAPHVSLTEEGTSVEGRALYAVRLAEPAGPVSWKVLFFGQQHGDEPAGKEALVELVSSIARDPEELPPGVELWVMPQVNPDGAEKGTRRSGNDADLNRDHLLLREPETQALHRLARRVRPHLIVDCHEFSRDGSAYADRGWYRRPIITMGTANSPVLPEEIFATGLQWVEAARGPLAAAGVPYERYMVGGIPPDEEIRPSTLEANDGRNGLASLGSLGFIIESGMFEHAEDPNKDLDLRVHAYLELLRRFLDDGSLRQESLEAVAATRSVGKSPFVATNVFWGNSGRKRAGVRVVRADDGVEIEIESGNVMHDRIFKQTVRMPAAYCVVAEEAEAYAALLDRHGLSYRPLSESSELPAEESVLIRVETEDDPVYERYGGRQIVRRKMQAKRSFAAGSLIVPVEQTFSARVIQLLEPSMLFGLYQYEEFQKTVSWDGTIPVYRLLELPEE